MSSEPIKLRDLDGGEPSCWVDEEATIALQKKTVGELTQVNEGYALGKHFKPEPATHSDPECQALLARLEYIMDPKESAKTRLERRAHLTGADLRLLHAALQQYTR